MARTRKYLENAPENPTIAIDEVAQKYNPVMTETNKSPAEVETTGPETINGIIMNALHVKVRAEPSFESDVVEVLDRGDVVEVLEKKKYFWKVRTSKGSVAYVSSAFIEEDRPWMRT